ncbi:complex I subunit 4 family protein [Chloroflexus sp. MS-G]|uniref:complex I subunit 4 family protein n=1 Tax=Chloroflexus sp. MS-G TaxID=1521187 RepID=UPI0004DFA3B0|nr:NADH-quinone oxidoreductase subunit M [Chloroflexus sp. MS-G]
MNLPEYLIPAADGVPWLTLLMLSPLVGIALIGLAWLIRLNERIVKVGVLAWTGVPLLLAIMIWMRFDPQAVAGGQGAVQLVERIPWIQAVQVDYFLGIDGLSLPLVLLTVVMTPLAIIASWGVQERLRAHLALLLLLEAAMLGYFVALDFFFFFICWEFSLVPAFFLIQGWGREQRRYAAFKFFVYTMAGSLGMLLLFQLIYLAMRQVGMPTFDLIALGRLGQGLAVAGVEGTLRDILFAYMDQLGVTDVLGRYPMLYSSIAMWAIFIAFAIKLAVWPFHTWLPDAYAEGPTAASILLSAVMSKMGAYGMLRLLLPFTPDAAQYFAPVLAALAVVGVVAGAFGALSQVNGDIKRLIGYTSINHMGYVMLAIAGAAAAGEAGIDARASAINGALVQMVAHGLSTGALFYLAGVLYERTGRWELSGLGGLRASAPTFAGVMGIALFANLGLPGLAGFVGEFFIFRGAWATLPLFTALAVIGLVVTALALLLMFQRIFLGPAIGTPRTIADLRAPEFWSIVPILSLSLLIGVYPGPLINLGNAAAGQLVAIFARAFS